MNNKDISKNVFYFYFIRQDGFISPIEYPKEEDKINLDNNNNNNENNDSEFEIINKNENLDSSNENSDSGKILIFFRFIRRLWQQ